MRKYVLLIPLLSFCLTACALTAPAASFDIPTLQEPVSVKDDTAIVARGRVQMLSQYRAFVRVQSEGLYYGDTDLRFLEYLVVSGQQVKEGDLLALLDTERILEDIEAQERAIANLKREHEFANGFSVIVIDKARAEYVKMLQDAAVLDEAAITAADVKRESIDGLELALEQQQERQAVTLSREEDALRDLRELLPTAELRAPFDGVISRIDPKNPGDMIEPYNTIIYITNGLETFVEVAGDNISVDRNAKAVGLYHGEEYELERIAMSRTETLFYSSLRVSPPVRYSFAASTPETPPVGSFMQVMAYGNVAEDVLRVPTNSLYSDADMGDYVYLVQDGAKLPTPVEVGIRNDSWAEIREGLTEGDEVFVKP
jgi:multidrug efflux pump subunit AcrA (membrane-fusion protein)